MPTHAVTYLHAQPKQLPHHAAGISSAAAAELSADCMWLCVHHTTQHHTTPHCTAHRCTALHKGNPSLPPHSIYPAIPAWPTWWWKWTWRGLTGSGVPARPVKLYL